MLCAGIGPFKVPLNARVVALPLKSESAFAVAVTLYGAGPVVLFAVPLNVAFVIAP